MAPRLQDSGDKMKVPGPGAYEPGDLDKCREKLPAFTMAPKTTLPGDNTPKPAPNAYSPEKVGAEGGISRGTKEEEGRSQCVLGGYGRETVKDERCKRWVSEEEFHGRPGEREIVDRV